MKCWRVLSVIPVAAALVLGALGSSAQASATPTVTVSETAPLNAVPSRYTGFSIDPANLCYVVSLAQTDPSFGQLFKNLGPGVFRVGGNTGDTHASWSTTATASCIWNNLVVTPALVQAFFAFAQSVGYQVMWQVPLGNNNPAEDAAEAAYVSTMPDLQSIEIGNEPNYYTAATTNYQTFINNWDTTYQDYLADGGTAPLSGPGVTSYQSFYLTPFLTQDSADITALTEHYYMGKAESSRTCSDLLAVGKLKSVSVADVSLARSYSLPFIMNETNTYSGVGEKGVSNAFCSALWSADYMLIGLENGVQGMYFHGVADYPKGNSGGAVQYYTPVNENGTPAPEYYGMLFYHQMALSGGSQVGVTTANAANIDAHAIAGGDGELRVALVNRNSAARSVTVHTALAYAQASEISLSAPALNSLSGVTLGGASVAANGTWTPVPQPVTVTGSTSVIQVPANTGVIVTYSPSA